jgi:hypothetical protein
MISPPLARVVLADLYKLVYEPPPPQLGIPDTGSLSRVWIDRQRRIFR